MKAIAGFLMALMLVPGLASAKMVDVERTVQGHGASFDEALNSALMQAVQQVRGAELATQQNIHWNIQHTISDRADIVTATTGVRQDVLNQSHGWVKSYEVVSINQPATAEGNWSLTAKVVVPKFESLLADDKRATLAVMPFRFGEPSYQFNNETVSGHTLSRRLQEAVQTQLMQSGRFAVVNRDYGAEYASEKALLSSDNVSAQEASRLGQVAGADLMLVGRIHHVGRSPKSKPFYGAPFDRNLTRAEVGFQLIEVQTQRVLWADSVRLDVRPDRDYETSQMYDDTGIEVTGRIIAAVAPIKVLDIVSSEQIFLNQGGKIVRTGQRYQVQAPGRSVQDQDAQRAVTVQGPVVAQVEVTAVHAEYSVAKLLEGDLGNFNAQSVLIPAATQTPDAPPARQTPGSSGAPIQW